MNYHLTTPVSLLWPGCQSPLKCTVVAASFSHAQTQPQSCHSLSTCIMCLFTLCISYVLLSGPRDCPSLSSPIPKVCKGLPYKHVFHMQTNQPKAQSQPPPVSSSHSLGHYPPALIAPGPGNRQLEAAPVSQSLLKLFRLAKPKPASPALPHLSHRTHNEGSGPHFPFTPSAF